MNRNIDIGLEILNCKDAEIYKLYPPGVPKSYALIATYGQCSRERIRQIAERGLRKLRNAIGSEGMEQLAEHFTRDRTIGNMLRPTKL